MKTPRRYDPVALLTVLVLAASGWIWFRIYTGIRLEDALITYRYAWNLAEGNGFVFNPGERVLGTTTPLFTLVLGLLGAALGPERIPLISNVLGMMAAAAAGLLTGAALRRFGYSRHLAFFVTSAFFFHPDVVWTVCGGMETPLVLLLMAWGWYALSREATMTASAAAVLLTLTRIDGVVWALGIYGVILLKDRAAFLKSALWGALVAAPWLVFSLWYFGSPIPHSVVAKRAIGNAYDIFSLGHFEESLASHAPFFASALPLGRPAAVLLFIAGALTLRGPRAVPALWLPAVYPIAFSLALYLGRAPLDFDWYLTPIAWSALIVGAFGIAWLGHRLAALAERRPWARRPARVGLSLFFAGYFAVLGIGCWKTALFHRAYQTNEDSTRRVIGEWLERNTPEDAVVAMEAVGYQAYYSKRRVIDLGGLVSPVVVSIRRQSWSNAEAFYRILHDLRPDYLVLRSFEVDSNVHYHGGRLFETEGHVAYFSGHYEEVKRFQAPLTRLWGNTSYLTVFRRTRQPSACGGLGTGDSAGVLDDARDRAVSLNIAFASNSPRKASHG